MTNEEIKGFIREQVGKRERAHHEAFVAYEQIHNLVCSLFKEHGALATARLLRGMRMEEGVEGIFNNDLLFEFLVMERRYKGRLFRTLANAEEAIRTGIAQPFALPPL